MLSPDPVQTNVSSYDLNLLTLKSLNWCVQVLEKEVMLISQGLDSLHVQFKDSDPPQPWVRITFLPVVDLLASRL